MLGLRHHNEIRRRIVSLVLVNVMHFFVLAKGASEHFLCNQDVLVNPSAIRSRMVRGTHKDILILWHAIADRPSPIGFTLHAPSFAGDRAKWSLPCKAGRSKHDLAAGSTYLLNLARSIFPRPFRLAGVGTELTVSAPDFTSERRERLSAPLANAINKLSRRFQRGVVLITAKHGAEVFRPAFGIARVERSATLGARAVGILATHWKNLLVRFGRCHGPGLFAQPLAFSCA